VLSATKFLDVAKITTLTPLSLLISCELIYGILSLRNSTLLTADMILLYTKKNCP
jgi:hypothetical protein